MRVMQLLEGPFERPWLGPKARQAALKLQADLLDIDDSLDIELVPTSRAMLHDAITNNGMSATFAPFMLELSKGEHFLNLLLHYYVRGRSFHLYHVDTDCAKASAERMYDHLKMYQAKVLTEESITDRPWEGSSVRRDALALQTKLLEVDDDISVELCPPQRQLLGDAVRSGMPRRFSNIALNLTYAPEGEKPWTYQLLIYYSRSADCHLYIVDKDMLTENVEHAFNTIKIMMENANDNAESLAGQVYHLPEAAGEPSAYALLSRFAKELVAKGFEAEVKSNSKPGIVNSSKLCIEVKGYGMKDDIKLYKPLWKHEQGVIAFVDVKTEKRFKTVKELVDVLKEKYPKLPKCLCFVPKPEKLKESSNRQLNIKERILKLQTDLIEQLPDDTELSDIISCLGRAYGANSSGQDTRFDRYVIVVKCVNYVQPHGVIHYVITVDDLDTVEVNCVRRPPSDGLVVATVYMVRGVYDTDERPSFELLQKFDYSKKQLNPSLKAVWGSDEATSGRQEGLDQLVDWLVHEADNRDN